MSIDRRRVAVIANGAASLVNFRGPMIEEMVRRGAVVYAMAPDFDPALRRKIEALGACAVDISLRRMGLNPLSDAFDILRLSRILRKLNIDTCFSYFLKPVILGTCAARLAQIPNRYSLIAGLGYVFTESDKVNTLRRRLFQAALLLVLKRSFRWSDKVFFQNDDDRDFLTRTGTVERDKSIVLAGTGVDLEHFAQVPLPDAGHRILFVGRVLREKGVREFLEAARLVHAAGAKCNFVLAGGIDSNPGALTAADIQRYVDLGLCEWLGHLDDIRPELAKASVFVLPSYREGKPRSTQEALAVGRPIITTDAVGCRDTVVPGVNGWLVPVRDAHSLAEAILQSMKDNRVLQHMGHASRALAENCFDVRKVNAQMLKIMDIGGDS